MKLAYPFAAALALLAMPLAAQQATAPAPAPRPAPKLLVVISVDQFSADLLDEYRGQFTAGIARLLTGAVFPSGYQGHAATETCPGHATILSGAHPARAGIPANDWIDFAAPREDKTVYCLEDETVPGTDSDHYVVSDKHLRASTLGEWMKLADPASRVVSVAGKDRAAVAMGGRKVDELWWWKDDAFVSYAGRPVPEIVRRMNANVAGRLAEAQPAADLPEVCAGRSRAVPVTAELSVGTGRFARAGGDRDGFRRSPELDESVLALGAGLAADMQLGQRGHTDLLILGASSTDYVGHSFGTRGSEMCLQLLTLDQYIGKLFAVLDRTGVDYAVVLTADHGGNDLPERGHASDPAAARAVAALRTAEIGKPIAAQLGLAERPLFGGPAGDIYFDPKLMPTQRTAVEAAAIRAYRAQPQVEQVYTRAEILATPMPTAAPDRWTPLERIRASYVPGRSGDLYVVLKPRITTIVTPKTGSVATHGTPWDYDRRVPILFWRKGMASAERPEAIGTVDIAPTLAAMLGVPVPVEIDGRCRDLGPGAGVSCR